MSVFFTKIVTTLIPCVNMTDIDTNPLLLSTAAHHYAACVSSPLWSPVLLQAVANRPFVRKVISRQIFTKPDLIPHSLAGARSNLPVADLTPLYHSANNKNSDLSEIIAWSHWCVQPEPDMVGKKIFQSISKSSSTLPRTINCLRSEIIACKIAWVKTKSRVNHGFI